MFLFVHAEQLAPVDLALDSCPLVVTILTHLGTGFITRGRSQFNLIHHIGSLSTVGRWVVGLAAYLLPFPDCQIDREFSWRGTLSRASTLSLLPVGRWGQRLPTRILKVGSLNEPRSFVVSGKISVISSWARIRETSGSEDTRTTRRSASHRADC